MFMLLDEIKLFLIEPRCNTIYIYLYIEMISFIYKLGINAGEIRRKYQL